MNDLLVNCLELKARGIVSDNTEDVNSCLSFIFSLAN